jgi:hypothetical protein
VLPPSGAPPSWPPVPATPAADPAAPVTPAAPAVIPALPALPAAPAAAPAAPGEPPLPAAPSLIFPELQALTRHKVVVKKRKFLFKWSMVLPPGSLATGIIGACALFW